MISPPAKAGPDWLRTFVCIKIPEGHLKIISAWINARRIESKEIRWIGPSNIHITLKFCGERHWDSVEKLACNLEKIKHNGPFSIYIEGLGGFPDLLRPRIVWAGIKGDIRGLRCLQRDVENAASDAGIPKEERPYSPHITLGRRASALPLPDGIKKAVESDVISLEPWTVSEIILMRSELGRSGARYTELGLFKI